MNLSQVAKLLRTYIGSNYKTQGEFMEALLRSILATAYEEDYPYANMETGDSRLSRIYSGDPKNRMSQDAARFFLNHPDEIKAASFIDDHLKGDAILELDKELDAIDFQFSSTSVGDRSVELLMAALREIANPPKKENAKKTKPKLSEIEIAKLRVVNGKFVIDNETYTLFDDMDIPSGITSEELGYIDALLCAFANVDQVARYDNPESVPEKWSSEMKKQRKNYYKAESIRRGIRDNFMPEEGVDHFDDLKDDLYDGIEETVEDTSYKDAMKRLKAVLQQASVVTLNGSVLSFIPGLLGNSSKKGICHMLVNDGRISWVLTDE